VRTLWTALANSGMSVDSAENVKKGIDWSVNGKTRVEGLSQSRTICVNQKHTTHWSDSFPLVLSVQLLKYCPINRKTIL
jgi:hypothetical protein